MRVVHLKVVVITGSREWPNRAAIASALEGAEMLIVGDCPTGADAIALEIAKAWDVITVVLVADWKRFGNHAGPMRNKEMAAKAHLERASGMDVHCHAFPLPGSRGTPDCIRQLEAQGFAVTVYPP